MKVIDVPEEIKIKSRNMETDEVSETPMPFTRFARNSLDLYAPEKRSLEQLSQLMKLENLFSSANGAEHVQVEDADHTLLVAAVESTLVKQWNPIVAKQLLPYAEAIRNARDVKTPAEEKKQ